jgi:anti-sigma factor RsiW
MPVKGTNGAGPPGSSDRELWFRAQATETRPDETELLLDLAAFADGLLDDEGEARVAALIAGDSAAAEDVAAARSLAGVDLDPVDKQILAQAAALVGASGATALVIAFPIRPELARPWYAPAAWSGVAAAIVLAGWLGFDLGSGFATYTTARSGDDVSASELFDPAPLLLRDFTENSQI